MKLLTVDTIEEAKQKLLDSTIRWKLPAEKLEISRAAGRILAQDIVATEDIPNFRRSVVDGYAVISADTTGAGETMPVFLRLAGFVEMGKSAGLSLKRGQCAYVPTGGMIPDGADAMVMVEYSEALGEEIALYQSAAVGSHVAQVGEDVQQGNILLRRGTKIRCQETGAMAALGIGETHVFAPLRLTIISSGDELVPPCSKPQIGQVRDINTMALAVLAAENGYAIVETLCLKDDRHALEEAVRQAMQKSDVVALSGGSSQGAKDMTAEVFSRVASPGVFTHGIALKPGKPTILGYDMVSDTILAGLPGHPVSALMVFTLLFSWLARQLFEQKEPYPVPAKISCNIAGSPGRTSCQPVELKPCSGGYIAQPVYGKSGMISTLTNADGYILINMNKEGLKEGEAVEVFLWR